MRIDQNWSSIVRSPLLDMVITIHVKLIEVSRWKESQKWFLILIELLIQNKHILALTRINVRNTFIGCHVIVRL